MIVFEVAGEIVASVNPDKYGIAEGKMDDAVVSLVASIIKQGWVFQYDILGRYFFADSDGLIGVLHVSGSPL